MLEWLGALNIKFYYNRARFDTNTFGKRDDFIINESYIENIQFDNTLPSFINGKFSLFSVEDETDWVQFGQFYEYEYSDLDMGRVQPSAWIDFPEKYKIIGYEL